MLLCGCTWARPPIVAWLFCITRPLSWHIDSNSGIIGGSLAIVLTTLEIRVRATGGGINTSYRYRRNRPLIIGTASLCCEPSQLDGTAPLPRLARRLSDCRGHIRLCRDNSAVRQHYDGGMTGLVQHRSGACATKTDRRSAR